MKDLLILGSGPHAGETAEIVERINRARPTWNLLGYIAQDKRSEYVGQEQNSYPILGTYSQLADYPDPFLGTPFESRDHRDIPKERLATLIDPSAFVSRTARIGPGCVIYPHCFVGFNTTLGDRVFVLSESVINHDSHLEDFVTICSGARLAGNVHVEEDCYLGQGCMVRQGLRIGQRSLIGMGAVVIADVPPNSVMIGNPARRLRDRDQAK